MEYTLHTPCTAEDLAPLRAGDTVRLSGVVYTARDQAHARMAAARAAKAKLRAATMPPGLAATEAARDESAAKTNEVTVVIRQ